MKIKSNRWLPFLLILAMVLSASGCGSEAVPDGTRASGTTLPAKPGSTETVSAESSMTAETEASETVDAYALALAEYEEDAHRQFLVTDAQLYEMMVRGRYYDLWKRRSDYFTEPKVYSYERTLANIHETDAGIEWIAKAAGNVLLDQRADRENYVRLLTMLICEQNVGFDQSIQTLTDYDTLKGNEDYAMDAVSLAWDAFGLATPADLELDLTVSLALTSKDILTTTVDSIKQYQMLKAAAENYEDAAVFLDTIIRNTDNAALKDAAEDLRALLEEARGLVFGGDLETYTVNVADSILDRNLMLNTFLSLVEGYAKEDEWAAGLDGLCKSLKKKVNCYFPGLAEAKVAYEAVLLAGDVFLGTTNTYNRFVEMGCLSNIAAALSKKASEYDDSPAWQKNGIDKAREAVPILEFLILTHQRGEYCVEQLVLEDGGLQSLLVGAGDDPTREQVEAYFDARTEELSDIYADVDMILCTGDEVYYRYLRDKILPKAHWACQMELPFTIPNWYDGSKGSLSGQLKAYRHGNTEEYGTGVLSAVVRDFDGDNIKDMLVIYLDTAPGNDTAIRTVYGESDAVTLRFELFTMQYNREKGIQAPAEESTHVDLEELEGDPDHPDDPAAMKNWFRIQASEWTPLDRYNVYSTADVLAAAEIGDLCMGRILAGICTMDGVPYIYTYEDMSDVTTDGPHLMKIWHVEDGKFIYDSASGWIGWGQGTDVEDVNAFCGAKGENFVDTKLAVAGDLLRRAYKPESKENQELEGSLLCRLDFTAEGTSQVGGVITTHAADYSRIREIMREGAASASKYVKEEPAFEMPENNSRDAMDRLAEQIGLHSGCPMTAADNREEDGVFTVRYTSASGRSNLSISMDGEGKLTRIALNGREEKEFLAVKDAVLAQESIGLDPKVAAAYSGDCGYKYNEFPGVYIYVNRVADFVFGIEFE